MNKQQRLRALEENADWHIACDDYLATVATHLLLSVDTQNISQARLHEYLSRVAYELIYIDIHYKLEARRKTTTRSLDAVRDNLLRQWEQGAG